MMHANELYSGEQGCHRFLSTSLHFHAPYRLTRAPSAMPFLSNMRTETGRLRRSTPNQNAVQCLIFASRTRLCMTAREMSIVRASWDGSSSSDIFPGACDVLRRQTCCNFSGCRKPSGTDWCSSRPSCNTIPRGALFVT